MYFILATFANFSQFPFATFLPTDFIPSLLVLFPCVHLVLTICTWMWDHPLGHGEPPVSVHIPKGKWLSLPQHHQQLTASWRGMGPVHAGGFTGLLCGFCTGSHSYCNWRIQQPRHVQETALRSPPLSSSIFSPLTLLWWSLEPWWREADVSAHLWLSTYDHLFLVLGWVMSLY